MKIIYKAEKPIDQDTLDSGTWPYSLSQRT